MVVKIHGIPQSTCVQRVTTTLKELNVPYEIILTDLKNGEHKSPEWLKHQPFGQIPWIEDDDFELFESRAIARYLVAKYGKDSGLVPQGVRENAKFEQAASIESGDFDPYASGIAVERVFKPMRGGQADEKQVEELSTTLSAKLKVYDAILSKQKFLAGDQITLADLFHLPYGHLVTGLGLPHLTSSDTPNVARWWKDVSTRDSWVTIQNELKQN